MVSFHGQIGFIANRTPITGSTYNVKHNLRGRYVIRIYGVQFSNETTYTSSTMTPRVARLESNEWFYENLDGNKESNKQWFFPVSANGFQLTSPLVGIMTFSGDDLTFTPSAVYGGGSLSYLMFQYEAFKLDNMIEYPLPIPFYYRFTILDNNIYGTNPDRIISVTCPLTGRFKSRLVSALVCDDVGNTGFSLNLPIIQVYSQEMNHFGCCNTGTTGGLIVDTRTQYGESIAGREYPYFTTNIIANQVNFRLGYVGGLANLTTRFLYLTFELHAIP